MARRTPLTRLALFGALGLLLPGCLVHADRLESAQDATRAERQAHEATARELFSTKQSLAVAEKKREALKSKAEALKSKAEARKEESEQSLAQLQFEHDEVTQDRDSSAQLVDQLRGELARVGGHLEVFGQQKKNLALQLAEAERRARLLDLQEAESARKVVLVRDVTLIAAPWLSSGQARIAFESGKLVLSIDAAQVFSAKGEELPLTKTAEGLLQSVGGVTSSPQPRARIEVTEARSSAGADPQQLLRLTRVAEVLTRSGLPSEHVTVSIPEPDLEKASAAPRVRLRFTLPSPSE